ncbi:putative ribonuclease H protein [Nymphaea thermarum]|nr:putative ribonuclease H protein [Nymphaea thermarum]
MANIGGWQAVKLPLDYLGVPLFTGNLNANLCAGLIAKFEKKLAPWKSQLLSYAGRACLITHNLSSMGNFWMQAFSLPNEVLKKLEQCMARFLWADTEVNRHIHQIVWHTLCKPKAEGGIGLRLLEEVNVSLLARAVTLVGLFWPSGGGFWGSWVMLAWIP